MEDIFGDVILVKETPGKSPLDVIRDEIHRYKSVECSLKTLPLDFWRSNCHSYQNIAKLAMQYLSMQATSVPSERVFSTAGDIVTCQRSLLDPESVDMLIFLKKNMR